MNPQQQPDSPNPYHQPREFEYPNPEAGLPPAPEHHRQPHKAGKSHTGRWVTLAVLITLALAAGAYFLFLKPRPAAAPKATDTTTSQPKTPVPKEQAATTGEPITKSSKLNIELTKPDGWTASVDATNGAITLTSPKTTYSSGGKSVSGSFILRAQAGLESADGEYLRASTAAAKSLSIAYDAPTPSQYQYSSVTSGGQNSLATFLLLYSGATFEKDSKLAAIPLDPNDPLVIYGGFSQTGVTNLAKFDPLAPLDFLGSPEYEQAIKALQSLKAH